MKLIPVLLLLLLLLLAGCNRLHYVKAYQQKAAAACHGSADQCRPLSYPSCEPGFNGQECH